MGCLRWTAAAMMVPALAIGIGATAAQDPAAGGRSGQRGTGAPPAAAATPMRLTTTAFADGAEIPIKYTQAGEQTSPLLVQVR